MTYQRCIKIQMPDLNDFNGILLVGEAPGAEEQKAGKPFVGPAGKLLDSLLLSAGIKRAQCAVTNVFHCRPEGNKIAQFFTADKDAAGFLEYPNGYAYLRKELAPEIKRLAQEIEFLGHHLKVIVALGGVALWALTGKTGISKHLGIISNFTFGGKHSCLLIPTFHPSYLLHKNNPMEEQTVVKNLTLVHEAIEVGNIFHAEL
jgi:uracil-DNA glycosylase